MVFFHIDKVNKSDQKIRHLEQIVKQSKNNKVFILIYMEGCGPCNATRPEWAKLTRVLHRDFANRGDISIVDIDTDLADNLAFLLSKPDSFPTIRFISRYGKEVEQYEDSPIETKDRSIDSFIKWIKLKTGEKNITIGELTKTRNMRMRRMTHKNTRKNYRMRKQRRTRRFGLRGSRIQ